MSFVLVQFLFWLDPSYGPVESRYQHRVGVYKTLEGCEERRKYLKSNSERLVLFSECRKKN